MPTTQEHAERAKQNLQFAQSFDLDSTPYLDWVVTLYFYSALHLVEALLYQREGIHSPDHTMRGLHVRKKPYLQHISRAYFELKDRSEDARYRLIPFSRATIERTIIPLYRTIQSQIVPQLFRRAT